MKNAVSCFTLALGALIVNASGAAASTPEKVVQALNKSKEVTGVVKAITTAHGLVCTGILLDQLTLSAGPEAGSNPVFSAPFSCNDKHQGANYTQIIVSGEVIEAADGGPTFVYPTKYEIQQSE
jgi:hypothetical protein